MRRRELLGALAGGSLGLLAGCAQPARVGRRELRSASNLWVRALRVKEFELSSVSDAV